MIHKEVLERILRKALEFGGDFAEVFFEDKKTSNITAEDGGIEKISTGFDQGVGIRVIYKGKESYAYTDDLSLDAMLEAARSAGIAAKSSARNLNIIDLTRRSVSQLHPVSISAVDYDKKAKINLIMQADKSARVSHEIKQVKVVFIDHARKIMVANSEGLWAEDEQSALRFVVQTVAQRDDVIQTGFTSKGHSMGMEFFDLYSPEELGSGSGRQALAMLNAKPAPSGQMTVIMHNAFGGVLFHEACGHGLESDSIIKGSSVFAGKVGQQVASSIVTAVDDPTIPNQWGSFSIDDEGTPAKRTVLIDKGILQEYMWDRVTAERDGRLKPTSNARRMSYRYLPLPRMTNTFIDNGESQFQDLFKNVQYGLFAKAMGGGQVIPATGDFVFAVREGYLIENGQVGDPVRNATLIGNGPEILHRIEMVANNLDFEPGMCGKGGQSVHAAVGQPSVLISGITVGGTARKEES